jgi:probable phosphoglycerate mutase
MIIVRHGETVWNHEMRFQGHGDSPLTARGRAQARAIGQRLKSMTIDTLISSDLGRARETADIIAQYTGHSVQLDARLRERHYGVLEGLNLKEILQNHSEVYQSLITENPDFEIPEGETHRQHYQKNIAAIEAWANAKPGTSIVLIAHGGVLDNIFRYVAHLGLEQPRCVLPSNASLSIIQYGSFYGSRRWVIKTWGDAAHLEGLDPSAD